MAIDISKFMGRFVEEAREHIGRLNSGLVSLEKNPEDSETINTVFRSAHTIKGSARIMKLVPISEVAHRMEDVLGALREKRIRHSKELSALLFRGADAISELVDKTAAGEALPPEEPPVCRLLVSVAEGNTEKTGAAPGQTSEEPPKAPPPPGPKTGPPARTIETIRIKAEKLDEFIKLLGEVVSTQGRLIQRLIEAKRMKELAENGSGTSSDGANPSGTNPGEAGQALCAAVKQFASAFAEDMAINGPLITELQERALTMRMVPLSHIFDSLDRLVRDISAELGREADFSVEGGDIELDKQMIGQLGDPLIHMLRNSIDHGIEGPEERLEAGKPPRGRIRLAASYGAGCVLIRLSDDGRGISADRIREKALKKNIRSPEALKGMSEAALLELIYEPGFSTSAIVTDISGRGVGMDIVRKNIVDSLRGGIEIETAEGKGTTFTLRLPLTLAIMRVLLFRAAGVILGIPAVNVTEILRTGAQDLINVMDRKAIRLREEIIPVAGLRDLLNMPGNGEKTAGDVLIAIARMGQEKLGLVLDELIDEENMVIKALPAHMRNIKFVSGVTVSGKNEVINVLHVPALMEAARKTSGTQAGRAREDVEKNILIVEDSVNTREIEKSILEAHGYGVSLAEDGMKALEKTKGLKYDLVVTDVEMPGLDGFSLTERLRADENYKDVPIIIVTSRQTEEDRRRGILAGADAYIVKGAFDQTNLIETIKNLIG